MLNFTHKPIHTDKDNADKVGQRLKTKLDDIQRRNVIEKLSNLRMGTIKLPHIELSQITDFPKLSKSIMARKIFYGNYYLKQSKSYLSDLLRNNKCSIISEKVIKSLTVKKDKSLLLNKIKKSKIICLELLSRHHRGLKSKNTKVTKKKNVKINKNIQVNVDHDFIKEYRQVYKVFIEYIPNRNISASIKCK